MLLPPVVAVDKVDVLLLSGEGEEDTEEELVDQFKKHGAASSK